MLNKVDYVDETTVIHAKNLNDIQDAIIKLQSSPAGGGVLSVNGKTPDDTGAVTLTAADVGAVAVDKIKVWISPDPTSPAEILGGTWTQIKDRFVLAAGSTYAAGSTGGEAEHTITVKEMPNHSHTLRYFDSAGTESFGYPFNRPGITSSATPTSGGVGYAGGGLPHNNMPPYISLYIWMRVTEEVAA